MFTLSFTRSHLRDKKGRFQSRVELKIRQQFQANLCPLPSQSEETKQSEHEEKCDGENEAVRWCDGHFRCI